MSTEQYYMRSKEWESRPPDENARVIETELIPRLVEHANELTSGKIVSFNTQEENYWIQRIEADKQLKPPKSLGCFLVALYVVIGAIIVAFVKFVLLK